MQWLTFGLGIVAGSVLMLLIISLLSANKPDEIEQDKRTAYKEGYKKGFEDGYEVRYEHKNR